jgi:hypothetical protein
VDYSSIKEMFSKFRFKKKKRNTFDIPEEQYSDDLILVVPSIL